jgi:cystathionine beta-lyase/cystathionine gamma-synthase
MNPTNDVFEQRIAALEGGVAATAVSSGNVHNHYTCLFNTNIDYIFIKQAKLLSSLPLLLFVVPVITLLQVLVYMVVPTINSKLSFQSLALTPSLFKVQTPRISVKSSMQTLN